MEATIERSPHDKENPYTMIRRETLEDTSLSWEARGVLAYILAKPNDWSVNVSDLTKRSPSGRDRTYRILKELREHGYVEYVEIRNSSSQVIGSKYLISEIPKDAPLSQKPDTVFPDTALPDSEKPEHTKESVGSKESKRVKKQTTLSPSLESDIDFYQGRSPGQSHARSKEEEEANQESTREWEEITTSLESKGKSVQSSLVNDVAKWALQYRLLDKAPEDVKEVSFLLWQKTGFAPVGRLPGWIKAIRELNEAARLDHTTLVKGIEAGEKARQESKLTFSGPTSYYKFVLSEASKIDLAKRKVVRRSSFNIDKVEQKKPIRIA